MFQALIAFDVRDRPICVGELVLDPETHATVGLIPRFVGFVDAARLLRSVEDGAVFEVPCLSFRAAAARRVARVYGDTDQSTLWPGDHSLKHISDAVNRGGRWIWNGSEARGSSSGGQVAPPLRQTPSNHY